MRLADKKIAILHSPFSAHNILRGLLPSQFSPHNSPESPCHGCDEPLPRRVRLLFLSSVREFPLWARLIWTTYSACHKQLAIWCIVFRRWMTYEPWWVGCMNYLRPSLIFDFPALFNVHPISLFKTMWRCYVLWLEGQVKDILLVFFFGHSVVLYAFQFSGMLALGGLSDLFNSPLVSLCGFLRFRFFLTIPFSAMISICEQIWTFGSIRELYPLFWRVFSPTYICRLCRFADLEICRLDDMQ